MRNDVKLGLAIGGVLLAVLIVYVLVVPGGTTKKPTQITGTQQSGDSGDKVTIEPVATPQDATAAAPPAAPGATFTPPTSETPEQVASADQPAAIPPAPAETATPAPSGNGKQIDWNKLLNDQQTLIAETPVAAATPAAAPTTPAAPAAPETASTEPAGAGDATTTAEKPAETTIAEKPTESSAPEAKPESPAANSTPPAPTGQPSNVARTHTVHSGETLSSIAAAAYGDKNLYNAIIRANPGIDPNRLKPGTTINIPALPANAAPGEPAIASAKIAPTIDATKQYRIAPGDSLHKISQKLYGKSDRADKIYELNKKSIGENPAKLKIGQVLELPEPPTLTASTR